MYWALLFFIELFALFLLSRTLTRVISYAAYRISKSKKIAVSVMAFLFFPGTLIHELAHAITAGVLGVHVGHMEFVPKIEGEKVKLGSVQIAHTDPLRRFLIGAAPFFTGTALLLGILYFAAQQNLFDNIFITILIGYVVFEIGNTMFSSSKDMEGAVELFLGILVIGVILYAIGLRLPALNPEMFLTHSLVQEVFKQGSLFLLIPLAIDTVIILLLRHK